MSIAYPMPNYDILTAVIVYNRVSEEQRAAALAQRFSVRPNTGWAGMILDNSKPCVVITLAGGAEVRLSYDDAIAQYLTPTGPTFPCKRLTETAKLPVRGTPDSAALDLFYDGEPITFRPGESHMLSTGIALTCPAGTYARVAPRSGLSLKGFDVAAGVVDRDYTGEIKVILRWWGPPRVGECTYHTFNPGDRIAQIIFEKIVMAEPVDTAELGDTVRGAGGYGSTGA